LLADNSGREFINVGTTSQEAYLSLSAFSYTMATIIDNTKAKFFQMIDEFGSDPYILRMHVPEVERWAKYLLKKFPYADEEAVLLAVWLHDKGHYPISTEIDHAVRGEERAKEFLEKENYFGDRNNVLHCVRAHRCRDVMPSSIEAKIVACADSASHMTEPTIYFDMARNCKKDNREFTDLYAKMDRDYRDVGIFPEIQSELKELYENWKRLIRAYEKVDL
jgi:hypothetical protein